MKRSLLLFALLALTPCLSHAAPGFEVTQFDLMKYIQFDVEWTSYKYQNEPLPKVKVLPDELLQIYAYGDFEYAQAEAQGKKLPIMNAVYLPENKTIYLSERLDLNAPSTEVTLVHELVHYLQDINGYTKSLDGHLACTENEAYEVQMVWQKIHNVDVESIHDVYGLSVLASIKCMGSKKSAFPNTLKDFHPEEEP